MTGVTQMPTAELGLVPRSAGLGRANDLPPLWDGHRVEWRGWTWHPSSARWHGKPERCAHCGCREEVSINMGLLYPLPGEEMESVRSRRLPSGRTYDKVVWVPAWPVYWLHAFRCPECWHDSVHDKRDDTWWDLDPSDYGDTGSVAP